MSTESEKCVDELLKRLSELDALLRELESTTPDDSHMAKAREQLSTTQSFIDTNQALIPGYCRKKAFDSLKRLENIVNKSHESKIKFNFKPKSPKQASEVKEPKQQHQQQGSTFTPVQITTVGFSGKTNENLALNLSEVESKDITLSQLDGCKVDIKGLANTVYISYLKNTMVSVSIACRAVTVKGCTNCEFRLVCQQLRIDSTFDSKFEIFTSARSMLESSDKLEFRRLNLDSEARNLMQQNNMGSNSNNWRCIDDFDWLSPNAPSQHYKLVEDN